jgi:hypothetical protein
MVLNFQEIITRILGQVQGEKLVYLIDAIGRRAQFHLDFILSAEVSSIQVLDYGCSQVQSLVYVLKNNLRNIGPAAEMIEMDNLSCRTLNLI